MNERMEKFLKVKELSDAGATDKAACTEVGVTYSSYRNWKYKAVKAQGMGSVKAKVNQLISLPIPDDDDDDDYVNIIVMRGKARTVKAISDRLGSLFHGKA